MRAVGYTDDQPSREAMHEIKFERGWAIPAPMTMAAGTTALFTSILQIIVRRTASAEQRNSISPMASHQLADHYSPRAGSGQKPSCHLRRD